MINNAKLETYFGHYAHLRIASSCRNTIASRLDYHKDVDKTGKRFEEIYSVERILFEHKNVQLNSLRVNSFVSNVDVKCVAVTLMIITTFALAQVSCKI